MKWSRRAFMAMSAVIVPAMLLVLPGNAQAAPSTLFGTPTDGAYKSTYEPVDMYRAFFTGAPGLWASDPKLSGTKPLNVSFKYQPSVVLSGSADTAIRKFFQTAPTNRTIWWTYFHEPEENILKKHEFTAAEFRAAWQHIWTIAHETGVYKANLKATLVLMDFDVNPDSGRNWLDFYPGAAYVDVLSWDVYRFLETPDHADDPDETMQAHQARIPSLAVTKAAGKPYAISELGYDNPANRPAFLAGAATWARDNNVLFVAYFDLDGSSGDHRLADAASQGVWRDAASGALFAGAPTAVVNPATTVTNSQATMSCRIDPHNGSYRVTFASWVTDGGSQFVETAGVTVADGPETLTYTRTGLSSGTNYTFRCKVYDAANTLVVKPPALTFTTQP